MPCTAPCLCSHFTLSLHHRASSHNSCEVHLSTSPLACLPTHGGPSTPLQSRLLAKLSKHGASRPHAELSPPECCLRIPVIAPSPQHRVVLSTPETFEPYTPRQARRQARQNPLIPLSLIFAHIPRERLPTLARVSRRFCAAAQLVLSRTLEHPATAPAKADACMASLAGALHLAELVTSLMIPTYPFTARPSASPCARCAHSRRSRSPRSTPTFSQWYHLPLRASRCLRTRSPLRSRPVPCCRIVHLALPNFVGVPPGAGEVPSTAVPHLTTLDACPSLAAALAPGHPVERESRVASTLYDGLMRYRVR